MAYTTATTSAFIEHLAPYLNPLSEISIKNGIPAAPFVKDTPGLHANAYYFGQPKWAECWLEYVHMSPMLKERWHTTAGSWDDKVVVDVGCGPGNLQKNIGDKPKVLIGVDVSEGTFKYAQDLGYIPLLADAHSMPLLSGCADIVALNGTIHHCDDMEAVLAESARLVKPGGVLIADHDPQKSAYDFGALGKLLWNFRMIVYRLLNRGGHSSTNNEQEWAAATEIHHKPGDGLTAEFFRNILEPLGFEVKLYPHNHFVGKEILNGVKGKPPLKMRVAQWLSGINSNSEEGALSLLCVARKKVS